VKRLAQLAFQSKLNGVICSSHEIAMLRESFPKSFKIVTPGVRPLGSAKGDQRRVKTPEEALSLGADAVVMGRPIFEAKDPLKLVEHLLAF
jgi:orotidine-5'-phosphate decarboxylase